MQQLHRRAGYRYGAAVSHKDFVVAHLMVGAEVQCHSAGIAQRGESHHG